MEKVSFHWPKYGPISRTAVFLVYRRKDIFNEICRVYGKTNFLFSSAIRWCKKFKSDVDSVEDAPHARRPKTATLQKIVEKVMDLVATDARFTTRHIAKCVGISVGAAHTILRRDLKMRRISARWIPHLVTKEQKLARVRIAKRLLKQFLKYHNRSFANIITGDETWVHFYEPKRKMQNKIWATKGGKRPCIAKRTMSIQKGNVCNFLYKSRSCYSDCRTKG